MAILLALELVQEKRWSSVTLFTDSKSALTAIETKYDLRCDSYIILRIKSILLHLAKEGIHVRLIWIPSHHGIPDNERVDELAKSAIREGRDTQIGVPIGEIKNYWKNRMRVELVEWCR